MLAAIMVVGLQGVAAQIELPLASEADGTIVHQTVAQLAGAFDADQYAIVVDAAGYAYVQHRGQGGIRSLRHLAPSRLPCRGFNMHHSLSTTCARSLPISPPEKHKALAG